ncbi:MAG: hypothetical protein R3C18_17800 [Planctomycetaceae bacterium]
MHSKDLAVRIAAHKSPSAIEDLYYLVKDATERSDGDIPAGFFEPIEDVLPHMVRLLPELHPNSLTSGHIMSICRRTRHSSETTRVAFELFLKTSNSDFVELLSHCQPENWTAEIEEALITSLLSLSPNAASFSTEEVLHYKIRTTLGCRINRASSPFLRELVKAFGQNDESDQRRQAIGEVLQHYRPEFDAHGLDHIMSFLESSKI